MNKKEIRKPAGKAGLPEETGRRLAWAASAPAGELLKGLRATLCGLDETGVSASRTQYGGNRVTRQKKTSLARRLADAFINP